jgi:heme/copper-type cytochrome/quinol oxidase subunit 2
LINKVNNQSSWTSSGCADACAGEPSCTDGCNRQRQQLIYIAIGAGIGLFVLIILIIICCCCLCRKSAKNGKYFELQKIYNQVNKSTIT